MGKLSEQDVSLAKAFVIGNGMYKLLNSIVEHNSAYSEQLIEAKRLIALYETTALQYALAKPTRKPRRRKSA